MAWSDIRRYGSGVGIDIRGDDLRLVAVKSRPGRFSVVGAETIAGALGRPAAEWGVEVAAFLKSVGMAHVAVTVCLPRRDVILRQIQLPPMAEKERQAAIGYQLDGLHPFGEEPVLFAASPLGGDRYLVAIALDEVVSAHADRFGEAGVPVASFTAAPAALHAALRLRTDEPPKPLLIADLKDSRIDLYGESSGRPLLAAEMNLRTVSPDRAVGLALADLRVEEGADVAVAVAGETPLDEEGSPVPAATLTGRPTTSLAELLPTPLADDGQLDWAQDLIPGAAAIESACPRLGLAANLLPEERRQTDSRWRWAPTAALAALLGLIGVGFAVRPMVQDREYAQEIQVRIDRLEAVLDEAEQARERTAETRRKVRALGRLETRTARDLHLLTELSNALPNTAWSTALEINDEGVEISGEAASAASLLTELNAQPSLMAARFTSSLRKIDAGERFQIRAGRMFNLPQSDPAATPAVETPDSEAPASAAPEGAASGDEPEGTLDRLGEEAQ